MSKFCLYCGKDGHTVKVCPKIEGLKEAVKLFTEDESLSVYDAVDADFKEKREYARFLLNELIESE